MSNVEKNCRFEDYQSIMIRENAIIVRGACKRYKKDVPILNGLNMTVPRGCIYGLLGASGCGKTTLLSCVVGVHKLNSGDIWILGGKPGTKESGIPGPRIGYMPQEIALCREFSVIGALYYFGRINGLEDDVINDAYYFMADLLELPPKNRLIKNLSGGQQRRVSFAASLIHRPELLILDEPTVGLDPLLREKIWDFLLKLAQEDGTAIVITTHYIEETKLAHKIGLMRSGKLLAETSPKQLLMKSECQSLEEAFLFLSRKQEEQQEKGITEIVHEYMPRLELVSNSVLDSDLHGSDESIIKSEKQNGYGMSDGNSKRLKRPPGIVAKTYMALLSKNFVQFVRHPGTLLFAFIFPLITTLVFFHVVGDDPKGLILAVVNEEAGNCDYGRNKGTIAYDFANNTCDFVDLSCKFLDAFDDNLVKKQYFETMGEAMDLARRGRASAMMHFPKNFSAALRNRRDNYRGMTDAELEESEFDVRLDWGDYQIGYWLTKRLTDRFFRAYEQIFKACDFPGIMARIPIRFEEPIFGNNERNYKNFVAPAFLATLVFFLACTVSSSVMISDRAEGVWDRSLVQGVKTSEILFSHLLTQGAMSVIQATIAFILTFFYFNLPCDGSLLLAGLLMISGGFCGLCYGFLISVYCTSHSMSNMIATGSFYPLIVLCGCLWPLEGMPDLLRYVSLTLPTTYPGLSLRGVMDKGSPIMDSQVYTGFIVTLGWTALFVVLSLLGLRSKSK